MRLGCGYKNMRMALKIGGGFGCLIIIVLAIGALGLVSMRVAKTDSDKLAEQYLPETAVAYDLERLLLRTMDAAAGVLAESIDLLQQGQQKKLQAAMMALHAMHGLAQK